MNNFSRSIHLSFLSVVVNAILILIFVLNLLFQTIVPYQPLLLFIIYLICVKENTSLYHPFTIFLFFFFFYNFTTDFVFNNNGDLPLFDNYSIAVIDKAYYFKNVCYVFMILISSLFFKGRGITESSLVDLSEYVEQCISHNKLKVVAFISFLMSCYLFKDVLPLVLGGGFNRIDVPNYINHPAWLNLGVLCYVGSIISLIKSKNDKKALSSLLMFGCYYILDGLIGGRKLLFAFILSVVAISSVLDLKRMLNILVIISIFAIFSRLAMDKVEILSSDGINTIMGVFGEFIYTNIPLYVVMTNPQICSNVGFESYFQWLFYLIPRDIYPGKPISLALLFAQWMGADMGFGFNLLAEAYCTSGNYLSIVQPISILFFYLFFLFLCRRDSFVYIALCALSMDLNRGELSYGFTQMITMFVIYKILLVITKTKIYA